MTTPTTAAGRELLAYLDIPALAKSIVAIEAEARAPLVADIAKWAELLEDANQRVVTVARLLEEMPERGA